MFLNAHQRLAIPPVLGSVFIFDRTEDPATRVPDIIAFMNDGDIDVTLHFDTGFNRAQVITTNHETFNVVSATSDKLKLAIDGETAIEFTITNGAARTAAQVAADINTALIAAGGNTALARAVVVVASANNYVAIVSGTTGQASSVQILTPTNHSAYTVLGLTNGTFTASNSFVQDVVTAITIQPKGMGTFVNPRKNATSLQIRGRTHDGTTGIASVIDATLLYSYSGVQQ